MNRATNDPPQGEMKIAAVIHSLFGGGAERVMAALVSRLNHRGHCVTLITLDDGAREMHRVDASVDRIPLDVMRPSDNSFRRIVNPLLRIRALRRTIRRLQPDVVLSFCDQTNITVLAATIGMRVPVVISERSDPSQQHLGSLWELARRTFYPRAAHTIALTAPAANFLSSMCPRGVAVIPSAIAPPLELTRSRTAIDAKRIIAIGRLSPEKGFDRLIEAFAGATSMDSDWTLAILGEGGERCRLEQLIQTLGLVDRVRLLGWVTDVGRELQRSTLFVLASHYEGFPSALMEAMAAGVPSLAVDCESGPREIIDSGVNGWLTENTTDALREGIERLIGDERLRESLGQAGRSVVETFSWDAMVDEYERVLQQQIKRPS